MKNFTVPTRETVSEHNQEIFDKLQSAIGFVPNLYASMAVSEGALGAYLGLQSAKSSLKAKEKEVINLVVSQVNSCDYCLRAHTAISKLHGFTEDQILEIRTGEISFDSKLNALAQYAKSAAENKGKPSDEVLVNFFNAGYDDENLVDAVIVIGDKMITNYLFSVLEVPVDFAEVPNL